MKRPRTLLSDEVVTLHPKCKGGKGHCLPRVPPICLNLLLGLHFPEQPQKGTEGSLSRHRLPWVRAFQGDGLPSVLERSPGCNPRPRDISASVTGHPRVWGQQPRKPRKRAGGCRRPTEATAKVPPGPRSPRNYRVPGGARGHGWPCWNQVIPLTSL